MKPASELGSLYRAVLEGDSASVRLLLQESAAGLQFRNEAGHTPLMASATTERPDIAKTLVDAGAAATDVSLQNGYTALHWALHHPPRNQELVHDLVALLAAAGAEINAVGTNKVTPLMLASWFGADRAAELLIRLGADVSAKDNKGATALMMARQRRNYAIVNMLEAVRNRTS